MSELNERIRIARETIGLERRPFGARFKPPVTYETVRAWEEGLIQPRLNHLREMAQVCGVREAWLITGYGPKDDSDIETVPIEVLAATLRSLSPEDRAKVIADAFEDTSGSKS